MSFSVNRFLSKTEIDNPVLTRRLLPFLCVLLFVYYFFFSLTRKGYYQHDEIGHLMQILGFWRSPLLYLTDSWSRGGYKILYAIPSLFGYYAVITTNILFTVGAAWNSYRIARAYELKYAWLAILLTGLQPFVINLSFRCYSEIPAMFFVTVLVYLYQKKSWVWVAVVASYLFTIREELAVFALLLGGYFVVQKRWVPLLCLGIAPVILNILGFCLYGDPLYVWNMMVQGGLKDTYQRSGFFYFWLMLPEISGIVVILPFITGYLAMLYWGKEKWAALKKYHAVFIVFTVYFLMHSAFTAESFGFGRSGGVARFMLVILPMVSVIALIGINFLVANENKWYKLIICSIAFLLLLVLWWRLDKAAPLVFYGYATLNFKLYNIAALVTTFIMAITLIIEAEGRAFVAGLLTFIILIYAIRCVKPVPLIGEDKNQVAAVSWLFHSNIHPHRLYANHPVAIYEYGKQVHDLWQVKSYDLNTVAHAQPGDVFVFDEHYTGEDIGKQLLSSNNFKLLIKVDVNNTDQPAWVVQRK